MLQDITVMAPTSGSRLLGLINADEFLADAASGVDQLVQPAERDRVLKLVIRLLPRLQEKSNRLIKRRSVGSHRSEMVLQCLYVTLR